MSSRDNTAIVNRFFEEVFGDGNFDYIDEVIAPDYTFNGLPSSAERTKKWAKRKRRKYRNLRFEIVDLHGYGDSVSFRWTMRGVNLESFDEMVVRQGRNELIFRDGQCVSNIQTDRDLDYQRVGMEPA
jgi:hypothetical protein